MEGLLVQFMAMRLPDYVSKQVEMVAGNSMGLILVARGVDHISDLRTVRLLRAWSNRPDSSVICSGDEINEIESSTEAA